MVDVPALVLLTDVFPFGTTSETFIEAEIEVLARRFDRVFVLPSRRADGMRPLPERVSLVEMPWLEGSRALERRRALLGLDALRVLRHTLARPSHLGAYARRLRSYLYLLGTNLLRSRQLDRFLLEADLGDAIVYDYWFENATLALALSRRRGAVRTSVCRAHRWDLYDEPGSGPVAFRDFKMTGLDAVFPVSAHGARYLRSRVRRNVSDRIRIARLGVRRQKPGAVPAGDPPVVLTCSSLIPRKGVDRVPEVLGRLSRPVHWLHVGDGPERPRVENAARRLPASVTWELAGALPNPEVLDLYRRRPVRVFLSLSTSEGVPVSMMEAMSFGIPVVAPAIQGIPELVTGSAGVLFPADASASDIACALDAALAPGAFDPAVVRAEQARDFDADRNFEAFADELLRVWRGSAATPGR